MLVYESTEQRSPTFSDGSVRTNWDGLAVFGIVIAALLLALLGWRYWRNGTARALLAACLTFLALAAPVAWLFPHAARQALSYVAVVFLIVVPITGAIVVYRRIARPTGAGE